MPYLLVSMEVCSACGQTIVDKPVLDGVHLGPIAARILQRLIEAGPRGVRSDVLFDTAYPGEPVNRRRGLRTIICQANKKLARVGKRIEGNNHLKGVLAFYRLVDNGTSDHKPVAD